MNERTSAFRSINDWKSALMTLPDNGFFELLRSVFGNIKTPFSKQKLMDDLFNFLSSEDIRKIIAAYIDDDDRKVIAAVALLNQPAPGELESFFSGEFSFAEVHAIVLNLEERLILYRYRDNGGERGHAPSGGKGQQTISRLTLNPVLESVLAPFASDTSFLFPSSPIKSGSQKAGAVKKKSGEPPISESNASETCFCEGRAMAAFFAFLYGHSDDEPLRIEPDGKFSGFRKKVLDAGKKIFPHQDLDCALKAFIHLELFLVQGSSLTPNAERIASFCELSAIERQEYWAAALYLCRTEQVETDELQTMRRSRLRRIAAAMHRFMGYIEDDKMYPEVTLKRISDLLEKDDGRQGLAWGARLFDERLNLPFAHFLAALEKSGVLEKAAVSSKGEKQWKANRKGLGTANLTAANSAALPAAKKSRSSEKEAASPVIVMDTAFSFLLYPEIGFEDAVTLASFCEIKAPAEDNWQNGASICFELTRSSAVRGFDQGMTAAGILELLNRLSHNRLDENLQWTLNDWETRYSSVVLHQGIVLTLAEDRRYLAQARPLSSLVRKTIAPGVYLLAAADRAEAVRALRKAGVDIIAQPPIDFPRFSIRSDIGMYRHYFSSLGSPAVEACFARGDNDAAPEKKTDETANAIKERFREKLQKMRLSKPEMDELTARIQRRLIVSESQLEGAALRYEKLEARGLDYSGKSTIAKYAIESGSLLDVTWPGAGGKVNQVVGTPVALEKKGGDSILVLKTQPEGNSKAPEEEEAVLRTQEMLRIPLGKISLLRRIKQSIFGE